MGVVRRAMTKAAIKLLAVCVGFCLIALALASPVAFAEGSPVLGGAGASPLQSPLVVPEAELLLGGEAVSNAEEARRASPEAAVARQESQTKYAGLGAEAASKLAVEAFPGIVNHPAGGLPQLPEGQRITNIIGGNAAQVSLPHGGHAVLESTEPIATESSGKWVPIDLGMREEGGSFHVAKPAAEVTIPKQLQDGVSLADSGVSLTPVSASGAAAGGSEGHVDGSVVFYGGVGVGSDVDEIVKPETDGFSEDAVLRSAASPGRLIYRVGLPEGASLVEGSDGSGAADILDAGRVIARVPVPLAQDATGATVPVSMQVEGDLLILTVDKEAGTYPLFVDPNIIDEWLVREKGHTTNWHFTTSPGATEFVGGTRGTELYIGAKAKHTASEWGAQEYYTQGESWITELKGKSIITQHTKEDKVEVSESMWTAKKEEEAKEIIPEGGGFEYKIANSAKDYGNSAEFLMTSTHAGELTEAKLGVPNATVIIYQEKAPEISVITSSETVDGGKRNIFYGSGSWLGPHSGSAFEIHAKDPGVGISYFNLKAGLGESFFTEVNNLIENYECTGGVQCPQEVNKGYGYESGMPDGEDNLEAYVKDAATLEAHLTTQKIKVDNEAPYNIILTGFPSNHEISDGQHALLKASATDGTSPTPSSGIASIMLDVDGQPVGGPQGYCPLGPCTKTAEWTLNAESYAAGEHTLTVVATDNAGNVADSEEFHLTVHHAEGVNVGSGSVNPVTGEFSSVATDVAIGVPGGSLTVSRSYRSRHLAEGTEGPLGPQWNLSLGAQQSLLRVSGGMILTGGSGEQVVFESKGKGEFTSPTGDADLTLLEKPVEGKTVFTLGQNGSVTTFEIPSGGSGVWMPSSVEGPNGTNAALYKFKVEGGVIEPKEELAPIPAGVSCGKEISELKEGCRALKFEYDEGATTAKGEKATEWGEFIKHLSKVKYIAWNASKTKTESVVAEYAYDAKGRLRAEWNPEVTPSPLKTTYGYDSEGHVTAVSTAGHEPELLEQGTIPGEASSGRLLAIAVPSAATAFGTGEAPVNKEIPTLSSTTPAVGTKINVNLVGEKEKTPGAWSASPLAFIYQWKDCNKEGKECSPIAGAVNQAYYPTASDEGHKLVAEVIALNATGAVAASSEATSTVATGVPNTPLPEPPAVGSDEVTTLEYQVPVSGSGAPYEMSSTEAAKWGQTDDPSEAMAIFPPDKVMGWPAKEYKRETVYYLDGKDRAVNTALPTGGASVSTGAIAVTEYNLYNDVTRTLSPDNRLKALGETGKTAEASKLLDTKSTYNGETKEEQEKEEKEVSEKHKTTVEPGTQLLSTRGPQHTVKLPVGKEGKVNEEVLAREHISYSYSEGAPAEGGPYNLVTKTIDGAETATKEEFDKRTTETSYGGQSGLGWKLRKPTSVITDPSGLDLVHTTEYNASTGNVIETKMPAASGKDAKVPPTYLSEFGKAGSEPGEFKEPRATAVAPNGNLYVLDMGNSRIEEFTPSGHYEATFGVSGKGNGQLSAPFGFAVDSKGNIWVADSGNDRIEEFNSKHEYVSQFGSEGTAGGQFKEPKAIAVTATGTIFVVDAGNNRIQKFNEKGEFISTFGFGVSNGEAKFQTCVKAGECHAGIAGSGNGQFSEPRGVAASTTGHVWVADPGNSRIQEFGESGEFLAKVGSYGTGNGQFEEPKGIAIDSVGNIWVTDAKAGRLQKFTSSGTFLSAAGSKGAGTGQFEAPWGLTLTSGGEIYIADVNSDRVDHWDPTVTGNEGAYDTRTIYYTTAANSEYSACGEQFAMANLPCETRLAAQPGTGGLPEVPFSKYTYNALGEPEKTEETVGSTTRTKTASYDAAGRLKTSAVSSTVGTAVPTVTDEYSSETGALEKLCANEGKPCTEGKPKTITSISNKLGQLESYTDAAAAESKTTYEYDIDGRIKKIKGEKGTETYKYSEATGFPEELVNEYGTSKLTFTATHDVEGNMLTEGYPNGMTAKYSYSAVGKPTGLEYKKETHCTEEEKEKCKWFKDNVVPSIHGQWIEQTSTLSHQTYAYDNAGRLTEVQNTPTANKNCTVHIYAYDEDSNRVSLTTRQPGTEGKCATEGGQGQGYTYDTADRLNEPGITYNTFGDIAALPAQNSEDPALTSAYYADNQVQSQTQNKQTISYTLDPAGRTLEADATGEPVSANVLSHYTGPGSTPAWSINTSTKAWKRNIMGINGSLAGTQSEGANPVLQLNNLHGDIVATASLSETATELASKTDTSEFGVPTTSNPEKYAWLGAMGLPTELPSGVIAMGARSYVPQLGRFLQPDPVPGGSANAYGYTFGDPVNTTDPTGDYVEGAYLNEVNDTQNREAVEREEAREAAARAAAEKAAAEAAAAAAAAAGPQYAEEPEEGGEEEGGEEEGESEYAAYYNQGKPGHEEDHVEEGVLYQPMPEAGEPAAPLAGGVVPLCKTGTKASSQPCAHRILRFHWHWWGVSVAFSRHDMHHLSEALAAIAGATSIPQPELASAAGVGAASADYMVEHGECLTIWIRWMPPSREAKPEKCYG